VAETGRTAVVKYLLDHGAKVDVLDDTGRTAMDVAKGNSENRNAASSREIVALLQRAAARN
jgi:ankyrin repeat protein